VARSDREELVTALKGANVDGFMYETRENDAQAIASFTSGAITEPVEMKGDATVVLKYSRVTDKKANTTNVYRTEAIRAGDKLTLQVVDIASGASLVHLENDFGAPPALAAGTTCGPPAFKNFDDCLCSLRAALQVEANRTCTVQFGAATCCINGTGLFSVHIFATPNSPRCLLGPLSNTGDLVFFRD
jgi:hypothetical protein